MVFCITASALKTIVRLRLNTEPLVRSYVHPYDPFPTADSTAPSIPRRRHISDRTSKSPAQERPALHRPIASFSPSKSHVQDSRLYSAVDHASPPTLNTTLANVKPTHTYSRIPSHVSSPLVRTTLRSQPSHLPHRATREPRPGSPPPARASRGPGRCVPFGKAFSVALSPSCTAAILDAMIYACKCVAGCAWGLGGRPKGDV